MAMGEGVGAAPGPLAAVATEARFQMVDGAAPDDFQCVAACFHGRRVAVVPPGCAGVGGQTRQGQVEAAATQQILELKRAHLISHGHRGQAVEQLVEQRRFDPVGGVAAVPGGELVKQRAFGRVVDETAQLRQ